MIGANVVATGNFTNGQWQQSVWNEGAELHADTLAQGLLDSLLNSGCHRLPVELHVEGVPYFVDINQAMTGDALTAALRDAGIRHHVAGLVANAIRSHVINGGVVRGAAAPLVIDVDL